MTKRHFKMKKTVSALLALSILLSCIIVPSAAEDGTKESAPQLDSTWAMDSTLAEQISEGPETEPIALEADTEGPETEPIALEADTEGPETETETQLPATETEMRKNTDMTEGSTAESEAVAKKETETEGLEGETEAEANTETATETESATESATPMPASVTRYETEPNDTPATAIQIEDGDENFGYISSNTDVDFWEVSFNQSGRVNFWLGELPNGCNYNLYIYNSNNTLLASSTAPTGAELIQYVVDCNEMYYIKIVTAGNYSTTDPYRFMVRLYPQNYDFDTAAPISIDQECGMYVSLGMQRYFSFVPPETGFYTLESYDLYVGDPQACLHNESEDLLYVSDNVDGTPNFKFTYHLMQGVTYYFVVGNKEENTSTYNFKLTKGNSAAYMEKTVLALDSTCQVSIDRSYKSVYYQFTPETTDFYKFSSYNLTLGAPCATLYEIKSSGLMYALTPLNQDSELENGNFRYIYHLDEGKTYYLVSRCISGLGNYNITVTKAIQVGAPYIAITPPSNYIIEGQSEQLQYATNPSGMRLFWRSSDMDIATVSSSGVITAVSSGDARISATFVGVDGYSGYVDIHVGEAVGIIDNTNYYIMNYNTGRLISLENTSDSNYTNVNTAARSASNTVQWRTERQNDGTYRLISAQSSTAKGLYASGTNVCICNDQSTDRHKFRIYRINDGTYRGLYYIRYGNYYVAQDSINNVYLTTSPSYLSVWSFMIATKWDADIFDHNYVDSDNAVYNTTINSNNFKATMISAGYYSNSYTNQSSTIAYNRMNDNDDVFVFRGHGEAGAIDFRGSDGVSHGTIAVNAGVASRYSFGSDRRYIEDLGKNELSRLRAVLYIGCSTANSLTVGSKTYDLLTATYEKGAHFVLGTTMAVYTSDGNDFLAGFIKGVKQKKNLEGCVEDGMNNVKVQKNVYPSTSGMYPVIYIGDAAQFLDHLY